MAEVHHVTEHDARILGPAGQVQARVRASIRLVVESGRVVAWAGTIHATRMGGEVTPQADGTVQLRLGQGPPVTVTVTGVDYSRSSRGGIAFRGDGAMPFECVDGEEWRAIGGTGRRVW